MTAAVPPELQVELVAVDQLRPLNVNPRRGDVDFIRGQLRTHGQYIPIVARRETREIVKGNHTWHAARAEGHKTIAVVWRSIPDDRDAQRFALSDNRASDLASYDVAELESALRALDDLTGTGYEPADLDDLTRQLAALATADASSPPADTPPGSLPPRPVTRPGDLILLGEHRLLCGDAQRPDDLARLLAGDRVHMLWTDPPYGVEYDPEQRESYFSPQRKANPFGQIAGDDHADGPAYAAWLTRALEPAVTALHEGAGAYLCHAGTMSEWAAQAFRQAGLQLASQLIWGKTVLVFGRGDYHWMHEPILYGWRPGAAHRWLGDRKHTTLQIVPADHYSKAEGTLHPNQKPVALISPHIACSSAAGDIVLDPFGGSGATLIAADQLGRRALLMELAPAFCDVIVDRWERHTGATANRPTRHRKR